MITILTKYSCKATCNTLSTIVYHNNRWTGNCLLDVRISIEWCVHLVPYLNHCVLEYYISSIRSSMFYDYRVCEIFLIEGEWRKWSLSIQSTLRPIHLYIYKCLYAKHSFINAKIPLGTLCSEKKKLLIYLWCSPSLFCKVLIVQPMYKRPQGKPYIT